MAGTASNPNAIDLRPLAVTVVVSGLALVALGLAVAGGWLGEDVGRGAEFCERWHEGCLKQPVNTLSNVGFVVAGLAIAWRARRPASRGAGLFVRTGVVTAFSVVVALLGPASAAMHATGTELGGALDLLSMHLVAAFVAAYAAARSTGGRHFLAWLVGFVLAAQSAALVPGQVPLLRHPENVTFVLLLLIVVWLEALHPASRGPVRDPRWIAAAVTTLVGAFGVWNLAQGPWCGPDSWVQGHGAWHLLCALSCWLLARYYASETAADDAAGSQQ